MNFKRKFLFLMAVVFSAITSTAIAQESTAIVVPYAPGGAADLEARHFLNFITTKKNIKAHVEYKPGAQGVLGVVAIMNAAPTDNVIGLMSLSPLSEALEKNPTLGFEYISALHGSGMMVVSSKKSGIKSLADLEKVMKEKSLSIGFGATGQQKYLDNLMGFIKPAKEPVFIPYKGAAPVLVDLTSDIIDLAIIPVPVAKPFVDNGQVVYVSADIRVPGLGNDLLNERYPAWRNFTVNGLVAPKGTSSARIEFWQKIVHEYLTDEESRKDIKEKFLYRFVPEGEAYFRNGVEAERVVYRKYQLKEAANKPKD